MSIGSPVTDVRRNSTHSRTRTTQPPLTSKYYPLDENVLGWGAGRWLEALGAGWLGEAPHVFLHPREIGFPYRPGPLGTVFTLP